MELNQLASAMLALVFAAVMLVTGLLFMERSDQRPDSSISNSSLKTADGFARDGHLRAEAVLRHLGSSQGN